jgi:hypothetical protein
VECERVLEAHVAAVAVAQLIGQLADVLVAHQFFEIAVDGDPLWIECDLVLPAPLLKLCRRINALLFQLFDLALATLLLFCFLHLSLLLPELAALFLFDTLFFLFFLLFRQQ